jgi:hypothetical protein
LAITAPLFAHTDDPLVKPETPIIETFNDKLNMYGDVRIRYQERHQTYQSGSKVGQEKNTQQERYRIRLGLSYDITDDLVFEAQTSSGRGNPTSGNVKFSNGLSIEQFKVDVLDLEYKFDNSWIRVGKSKHQFYRPMKTQLIWDNDIRPEGVSYGYKDGSRFTALIWKVHRDEHKSDPLSDDIYVFATQYIHQIKDEDITYNVGGGFHYYDGVKGNTSPYGKGFLGNAHSNGHTYDNDYSIVELTGEVQFKDVFGKPFKASTVFAYNAAVSNDNLGADFSIQWGSAKKNNLDWKLGYTYRYVEQEAVFAAHNDSDFIGGGTDGKGHIFTGKIRFNPNLYGAFHYQISETRMSDIENAKDYERLMVDMILKF